METKQKQKYEAGRENRLESCESTHNIGVAEREREREASEAFYTREMTPSTKLPSMEDVLRCFYY